VYKESIRPSSKIKCTEVKWTATKLHISPDKTDRARSRSFLQMRDSVSDSDSTPMLSAMSGIRSQQRQETYDV